jgi:hypothetical protein
MHRAIAAYGTAQRELHIPASTRVRFDNRLTKNREVDRIRDIALLVRHVMQMRGLFDIAPRPNHDVRPQNDF